jgi:hypothetical protein
MKEEWTVIRSCVWLQEADVIRSFLEASGIEVLIPDEHFLGAQPHSAIAIGGVRVMVRGSDLDQARAILNAMETPEADSGEDPDEDPAYG